MHFFSKRQQIWLHVEMLAAPNPASSTEPGLYLVENQQDIALIANLPQLPQPFATEMIVAAFPLDRFDYDRGDVGPAFIDELPNFRFRFFLALNHIAFALIFREGKIDCWIGNPRPVEFGEQIRLARVGIRQAHGVTGTTMKGVAKMQNLGATFAATSRHIFANLPIHRRL